MVDLGQEWQGLGQERWICARSGGTGPGVVDLSQEWPRMVDLGQGWPGSVDLGQEWWIWARNGGSGSGLVDLGQACWIWARIGGSGPRFGPAKGWIWA